MEKDGAHVLDIGGESTRPGSSPVSESEEIDRILPVIKAVREHSSIPLSVDTRKSGVARKALEAGADMINDISALQDDPEMATLIAEYNIPVILMHKRGQPETMQVNPYYNNVIKDVRREMEISVERALAAGIDEHMIIIDPGIGFGKRQKDNLEILRKLPLLRIGDFPLLIGLSRKSFLGEILGNNPEERLAGSLAAHAWCLSKEVDWLRVHDVRETADLISVWRVLH
jgi:dihydropteroate synthase